VTAYKIASSLVVKPDASWTASDRASVEGYRQLKQMEKDNSAGNLAPEMKTQLDLLRDRNARGELHSYITLLDDVTFYTVFAVVVGTYIVLGGMARACRASSSLSFRPCSFPRACMRSAAGMR
jgi:hypothetical protein